MDATKDVLTRFTPGDGSVARRLALPTAAIALTLVAAAGCARPEGRAFQIVDHRDNGSTSRYRETFGPGTFDVGPTGNYEIVLVKQQINATDPAANIEQLIHIRTMWQSIPGRTVADKTQINAIVSYFIQSGEVGQAYEGAGSLFNTANRDGTALSGSLDLARLRPVRQLAASANLFDRVDISGRFTATRDRKRTEQLAHEMDRRFGPRPRSVP